MNEQNIPMAELIVDGMSCSNCAMGVRKRLEKQGMEQVDVNFATGEVRFENVLGTDIHLLTESIEDLGYTVRKINNDGTEKKNS